VDRVYRHRDILGDDYIVGEPTKAAMLNCDPSYVPTDYSEGDSLPYWLRTPIAYKDYPEFVSVVSDKGYADIENANNGCVGVRPAFYLTSAGCAVLSGNGCLTSPYMAKYINAYMKTDIYINNITVNIRNITAIKPVLIASFYSDNGVLVDVQKQTVEYASQQYFFSTLGIENFKYVKIFLWNNMNNISPIAKYLIIKNT